NRDYYAAHLRKLRLVGAEPIINQWVAERTAHRIKDLLKEGSLDETSRLVLVNAVYFKGQWKYRFAKADTYEQAFRLADGKSLPTPMMHQTARLRYGHFTDGSVKFRVLELPYKDGEVSMLVLLPDALDGVQGVEDALTAKQLEEWCDGLGECEVRVTLPRF